MYRPQRVHPLCFLADEAKRLVDLEMEMHGSCSVPFGLSALNNSCKLKMEMHGSCSVPSGLSALK